MFKAVVDPDARDSIRVGDISLPVRLVPHARARRYRLVFDNARGELRLTLPRRASRAGALNWAREQQGWIADQLAKSAAPIRVEPGTQLPLFGTARTIIWDAAVPRAVRLEADALYVGGPAETVGRRLERWLKQEARTLMDEESRTIAARAGLHVGRVGVGDPRSRWGSCTASGDLRYSWRLIMAPHHVRRATVAHEVAHLRHMDHGADFHALVAALHDGDVDAARQWLRREGRSLHRYRFDD
ncbi:M48 family metallopeptidase [Sphingopyxis sp. MWB1]|uniref:M48 family metallopeptidase n=1 Tax=Sphingopyxis sp. MWB1 TaxID=1537715 RepID=UPI001F37F109|nr:YgjP-like metallopeptidase domain-containing protein [Sphingopyxis sp. MWB1]